MEGLEQGWLRFTDPAVERAFHAYQTEDARTYARWGMFTAILGYCSIFSLVALVHSGELVRFAPVCLTTIALLVVAMVASTVERATPYLFWFVAAANVAGGAGLAYGGHVLVGNEAFALGGTIVASFYAGCVFRMPFGLAAGTPLVYFAGYQAMLVLGYRDGDVDADTLAICTYGIWMTWLVVIGATFVQETSTRRSFVQRMTIARQQSALETEQAQTQRLLLNVLPEEIAARLKGGETTIADRADEVTVLFADLVNFTPMSAGLEPSEVVALLDRVFSRFDEIADGLGLEKIKTIGDAYMVASGLPRARPDHAQAAADMALAMRRAVDELGLPIQVRIGLHSGAVVAGIIGKRKFSYDLWGDTVNTASRMESHGIPGEIQVSEQTWQRLRDTHELRSRGAIDVKGKGSVAAYLLDGRSAPSATTTPGQNE